MDTETIYYGFVVYTETTCYGFIVYTPNNLFGVEQARSTPWQSLSPTLPGHFGYFGIEAERT